MLVTPKPREVVMTYTGLERDLAQVQVPDEAASIRRAFVGVQHNREILDSHCDKIKTAQVPVAFWDN